jgi:molybdopterin-guanine dinucleotide biosynthesis protein A
LAGILAGLDWAAAQKPLCSHVASFAGDAPFLPLDLVDQLARALAHGSDLAAARSLGQAHPVFGLWPVALRGALRRAMTEEGLRKVDQWTARYRLALVDFPAAPVDPFFNLNHPQDLAEAERLAVTLEAPFAPG